MFKNFLKIFISVGLLALLATKLDWHQVWARTTQLSWWALPIAIVLQMLIWALANVRWWILIRVHGLGHTYGNLIQPTLIGAFFNNLLPSSAGGDLFRIYHIYRQGHGATVSVSPILTERAVGLMCMFALATFAVYFFHQRSASISALLNLLPWLLLVGILGLVILSIPKYYYYFHRLLERWRKLKPVSMLLNISEATHTYLSRPRVLVVLILTSFALQLLQIMVFLILGLGIQATLPASQYLFIVPVILVVASIPITIGGLGIREATAITLFTAAGMSQDNAAAISLLFIPVLVLSGMPGLWFFFRMKDHKSFYKKATHMDVGSV